MNKSIKIACVADTSPKAQAALKEIKKNYEVVEITKRRMAAAGDTAPPAGQARQVKGVFGRVRDKFYH